MFAPADAIGTGDGGDLARAAYPHPRGERKSLAAAMAPMPQPIPRRGSKIPSKPAHADCRATPRPVWRYSASRSANASRAHGRLTERPIASARFWASVPVSEPWHSARLDLSRLWVPVPGATRRGASRKYRRAVNKPDRAVAWCHPRNQCSEVATDMIIPHIATVGRIISGDDFAELILSKARVAGRGLLPSPPQPDPTEGAPAPPRKRSPPLIK